MKVKELFKDVQDVELTAEQEKQIKDYLGIKEPKVWKPEIGDTYYYLDVVCNVCVGHVYPDFGRDVDGMRLLIGNIFRTKEEAEFAAEQLKVYAELKRYAAEHNDGEIDWCNNNSEKYFIRYNNKYNRINIDMNYYLQNPLQVYFTSEQITKDAIKAVGEDRIKKYLFGVK